MRSFIAKTALFFTPLYILFAIYVATDVFKVIYHYNPYCTDYYYVLVNRAYGSTMTYINQNPKYHYDSFIWGNSRSLFYEIDTWKKYLPKGSVCMHFDESGGSISGIRNKIAFVDKNMGSIKNALLVIDTDLLSYSDPPNKYYVIEPPVLKGNNLIDIIDFQVQHFKTFLNPTFLMALTDYNLFKIFRPYMAQYIIFDDHSLYIPQYNEYQKTTVEDRISKGNYYNAERMKLFEGFQKPGTYSTEIIGDKELSCFKDIKAIFDKHKTSYKVVISPLYDQIKLNRKTYSILCSIFGKDHVYDFSGPNKWNKDYHNYYENSHYRPIVSAEIMDIIYRTKKITEK